MKKPHYIDNKKFTKAIIDYNSKRIENEEKGLKNPKINDYIGDCLLKIANRLITKRNFAGYSWKEEMIDDAVMSMVYAVTKFNVDMIPEGKTPNALAYFTSVANRAFINRIQHENKQLELNDSIVLEDIDYRYVLDHYDEESDFINLDNNYKEIESIHNKRILAD